MNLKEIQQLVKLISTSNVDVLEIEQGDFRLKIKRNEVKQVAFAAPQMQSLPSSAVSSPAQPTQVNTSNPTESAKVPDVVQPSNTVEMKSPMIGTFYRSASPDKPAFVNVGDEVKEGQTLCIVEAMKLFNEIEAEFSGRIVKVLVDDASPVEYDQPLFLIEPI